MINNLSNHQQGSALITVLIFSVVMTGLLLSTMETNWLTNKMNNQFYNKFIAFNAAETGLISQVAAIQQQSFIMPSSEAKIVTQRKLINEDACQKKRYQILASAEYRHAVVNLRSIYEYLPMPTKKCVDEKIDQRVYWQEL